MGLEQLIQEMIERTKTLNEKLSRLEIIGWILIALYGSNSVIDKFI